MLEELLEQGTTTGDTFRTLCAEQEYDSDEIERFDVDELLGAAATQRIADAKRRLAEKQSREDGWSSDGSK